MTFTYISINWMLDPKAYLGLVKWFLAKILHRLSCVLYIAQHLGVPLLITPKLIIRSHGIMKYFYSKDIFFLLDWQVMCGMIFDIMRMFCSSTVFNLIVLVDFLGSYTIVIF